MKQFLFLLVACLSLGACFPLQDKAAAPTAQGQDVPAASEEAQTKKRTAHSKNSLPDTLGGLLNSDRWVIYKEKQEEEFIGNVSYENDQYRFRADYVRSQRSKNLLTAEGNVFIRKQDPDGTWYELHADKAVYNYTTGEGYALAQTQQPVIRLIYHTAKGDSVRARAKRADFNTQAQTYQLSKSAVVTHIDLLGQKTTLKANRISARQKDQYALLEGNADVSNTQYHLQSDRIEYDGTKQLATAFGGRALADGTTEQGTFAIIADKATAQTDSRKLHLEGQVQGWIVSEQLNAAEKNAKKK